MAANQNPTRPAAEPTPSIPLPVEGCSPSRCTRELPCKQILMVGWREKTGRYPQAVKLGPRMTAWHVDDIRALIAGACNATNDAPFKEATMKDLSKRPVQHSSSFDHITKTLAPIIRHHNGRRRLVRRPKGPYRRRPDTMPN